MVNERGQQHHGAEVLLAQQSDDRPVRLAARCLSGINPDTPRNLTRPFAFVVPGRFRRSRSVLRRPARQIELQSLGRAEISGWPSDGGSRRSHGALRSRSRTACGIHGQSSFEGAEPDEVAPTGSQVMRGIAIFASGTILSQTTSLLGARAWHAMPLRHFVLPCGICPLQGSDRGADLGPSDDDAAGGLRCRGRYRHRASRSA